jgi:hypothetical protein
MAFIYDLTDTWNAGGTTFNAIKMNVTDTASAAASKLVTLQVGGSERFSVDKAGNVLVGNGGDLLISSATGGNNSVLYNDAQDLYIATNGSTRMYISSSGDVGVGNVSPGTKLDVTGNIRLSASTPTIELNSGGPLLYSPAANTFAVGTGGGIGSPVERMRINSSGNVGIGSSSPGFILDVQGSTANTSRINVLRTGGAGVGVQILSTGSDGGIAATNSGPLNLYTSDLERMRVTAAGNVGIGTSSPATQLQVAGEVRANTVVSVGTGAGTSGGDDNLIRPSAASAFLNIKGGSGRAKISIANDAMSMSSGSAAMQFFTSAGTSTSFGTERMRITDAGNVGIGTSSPSYKLQVTNAAGSSQVVDVFNSSTGSSLGGIVCSIEAGGNNTNSFHFLGVTQTVAVYQLFGNGTTSYTSDIRVKKNVETTRDGYLDDVCKLRVVKYNWYNDEDDTPRELGFIAQEVEQVFPGLVQDALYPTKDGVCHKVLKASVLVPILTKALQEANEKIDALEARMTALEASASTIMFQGN